MTNTAYAGNATDITVEVRGFVASTGLPYTAGTHSTSGLEIAYIRNRSAAVTATVGSSPAPVTQTANGAHTDWGFVHVNAGVYRIDIPDAAVASGADDVVIVASGITDVVFTPARIEILGSDPRSATVAANVTAINGATVVGNGTSGNKWRA